MTACSRTRNRTILKRKQLMSSTYHGVIQNKCFPSCSAKNGAHQGDFKHAEKSRGKKRKKEDKGTVLLSTFVLVAFDVMDRSMASGSTYYT